METLATYLPFYRLHEVVDYFVLNVEMVRPKRAIVYIDNVYTQRQLKVVETLLPRGIEYRVGNWRSRGGSWLAILRDHYEFGGDLLVVDSDNVLAESFMNVHRCLSKYFIYSILDLPSGDMSNSAFVKRSRKTHEGCEHYLYPVYARGLSALFRRGPVFFIGPKQAVYLRSPVDRRVLERVDRAFERVPPVLRQYISDETVLGVVAYFCGVEEVPWTFASLHYAHGSTPGSPVRHVDALARYKFAKALHEEFRRVETLKFALKYLLAFYKNAIFMR